MEELVEDAQKKQCMEEEGYRQRERKQSEEVQILVL